MINTYFSKNIKRIITVYDEESDDEWLKNMFNILHCEIDIVYLGESKHLDLWSKTKIICKMIKRNSIEDGGISGTYIRRLLEEKKEIYKYIPCQFQKLIIDLYNKRKYIINDIIYSKINSIMFDNMIRSFESLSNNIFNGFWVLDQGEVHKGVKLYSNKKELIKICNEMFLSLYKENQYEIEYNIYAFYLSRMDIPKILEDIEVQWNEIKIHEDCLGYMLELEDNIRIIKTWDYSRLYLWNINRGGNNRIL